MNKKLQYTRDSSGSCQVNGPRSEGIQGKIGKVYPGQNYESAKMIKWLGVKSVKSTESCLASITFAIYGSWKTIHYCMSQILLVILDTVRGGDIHHIPFHVTVMKKEATWRGVT